MKIFIKKKHYAKDKNHINFLKLFYYKNKKMIKHSLLFSYSF